MPTDGLEQPWQRAMHVQAAFNRSVHVAVVARGSGRVPRHRLAAQLIPEAGMIEPPHRAGGQSLLSLLLLDEYRTPYNTSSSTVHACTVPILQYECQWRPMADRPLG